jgi:uncharacterized protein
MLLRTQDKEEILSIINECIQQKVKVFAFGSRVNGKAHETSDLDLVLISENKSKIAIEDFVKLKEHLQKSNVPIFVQVLDWYRVPKSFHENILSNYEVFE